MILSESAVWKKKKKKKKNNNNNKAGRPTAKQIHTDRHEDRHEDGGSSKPDRQSVRYTDKHNEY